ncbi:MAG TPA: toast rack family protein [Anaerolineales bacterium]|nr:toast rack family protein [Anaerolineales bacterium]
MNIKIITAVLALALASMACGFSIDLPRQAKVGPEIKDSITVAVPRSDETRLNITFGAGDLNLSSGAENLVDGTAIYNVKDLRPEVNTTDGNIEIKQGNFEGIPPFDGMKNKWDLKLSSTPMDLTVTAGAYSGNYDLGGLALKSLTVKDGAAHVDLTFSQPNTTRMSVFRYETGASNVKLTGLANANFNNMTFSSGAGDYTLDFTGELKRDATVNLSSGLSNLIVVIPEDVNAEVTVEGALANVSTGSGWSQNGNLYSQAGSGPTLTFIVKMGAGNLTLTK